MKFSSFGKEHILVGISPDNKLFATFNCSNLFISPMESGNGPTRLLLLKSSTVTLSNSPISEGTHPFNPLFTRRISFKVSFIFDKLEGRQPLRSLFAKTTTETGEFPIFLGKDDWNLLLLMNKASSFKSKRVEGMLPW